MLDLDAIRKRVEAATPGPWVYNSYSRVDARPLIANYDDPDAPDYPDDPRPCHVTGIAFDEADNAWIAQRRAAYEADPEVAHVPAEYGDTATGRHAADAEFIAHARTDVPALLAEAERLRAALSQYADQRNWFQTIHLQGSEQFPTKVWAWDDQREPWSMAVRALGSEKAG